MITVSVKNLVDFIYLNEFFVEKFRRLLSILLLPPLSIHDFVPFFAKIESHWGQTTTTTTKYTATDFWKIFAINFSSESIKFNPQYGQIGMFLVVDHVILLEQGTILSGLSKFRDCPFKACIFVSLCYVCWQFYSMLYVILANVSYFNVEYCCRQHLSRFVNQPKCALLKNTIYMLVAVEGIVHVEQNQIQLWIMAVYSMT